MSKSKTYYLSDEMKRTLEEIKRLCAKKKDKFGCISLPLLNIELANVRVDVLHLLLRVTGTVLLLGDH